MLMQIEDWRRYLDDGHKFLKTAINAAHNRPEVFTPIILYNLTAMAIEKFCMGYLMYHGDLADNHTMADLATAVERHAGPLPELTPKLIFIDSLQEICDIQSYKRQPINKETIAQILVTGRQVEKFIFSEIRQI